METFYLEIRSVHITAVIASGLLFTARGALFNFVGAQWPMAAAVRYLSYTIDTVLLTAALMLMTIVRQYPLADAWLTMKVLLVLVYILLGWRALRASTRRGRIASLLAALVVYLFIITVARAHDPLGIFAGGIG